MLENLTSHGDFLARHPATEHAYLATVHAAVASGACLGEPPSSAVACDQLLTIYRGRAVHLARFNTQHAKDLGHDTLRFCEQLETAPGAAARWWIFRMPDGVHYYFAEHAGTHQLLGALKTVSKLEVDQEEWDRLWND